MLHIAGFVTVCEAFVGMEPYIGFFRRIFPGRASSVGKPPRTALIWGFALVAAQVGQFIKFDETSETSTSHGGHTSVGSVPIEVPLSGLQLITMA